MIPTFTIGTTWELSREKFSTFATHIDVEAIQTLLSDARRKPRAPATEASSPWLFCTINLNREKGDWCCEWLDDLRHKHHFLDGCSCFFALQETDSWTTSAVNVPGYIVYGNDHGRTAILCPREVNHFSRSWADHERCTAIMVGSTMLLSVFVPHSGRDEEEGLHRGLLRRECYSDRGKESGCR